MHWLHYRTITTTKTEWEFKNGISRHWQQWVYKTKDEDKAKQKTQHKAKIKKLFVSRTQPTVRKRCDSKYFFAWFATTFFFGYRKLWPEVPILFHNLRLELVYTFKWTKSVAQLWRNQICEWTQSILKKKKNISTYLPTHRWNGGSGVGNEHIFKGGLAQKTKKMSNRDPTKNRGWTQVLAKGKKSLLLIRLHHVTCILSSRAHHHYT